MGDLEEIKTLLQTNLSTISTSISLHSELILNLQKENQKLKQEIMEMLESRQRKDPLRAEIINKFKRNKKRMIKSKIIETIKFHQLSVPEIKEIIVDQHSYCSKATFYRYVEEMVKEDYIHVNEQNKVKIKPLVEAI